MTRVVVIGTGGTIASVSAPGARGAVAEHSTADLMRTLDFGAINVEGQDLFSLGSYLLNHGDLRRISEAVAEQAARSDVYGIVITHGTDTMEESAYLVDLVHGSDKPVVFTGAQKAADRPDTDGPQNLRDAVAVAASPEARGFGAVIAFGGRIYPAQRTRKQHTIAPEPFRTLDGGPIGRVTAGQVHVMARPVRQAILPPPDARFDQTRVDVVTAYPGVDAALARAAVSAGAEGVVLAGTGAGNGNAALLDWTHEAVGAGIVVGLSTRVAEGPVAPIYGNGGGADLVAAGAIDFGGLPLYHGRLLLALLLAGGVPVTPETIAPFTT